MIRASAAADKVTATTPYTEINLATDSHPVKRENFFVVELQKPFSSL
jgi:hypothetical protein